MSHRYRGQRACLAVLDEAPRRLKSSAPRIVHLCEVSAHMHTLAKTALVLVCALCLEAGLVQAQVESVAPSISSCNNSSRRVCNNNLRSCNSTCTGQLSSTVPRDPAICQTTCCVQLKICLHQRGCDTSRLNC